MKYHNLTLDDVIRRLLSAKTGKTTVIQGCVALAPSSGSGPHELLLAYHSPAANALGHEDMDYGEVRLVRESVSLAELWRRLAKAQKTGILTLAEGVSVELERMASMELLPSDEPASGLGPRYGIELSAKRRGNLSGAGPLVRFGQLSYPSVEQAIRSWIPLRPFHGSSDARLGKSLIEVPLAGPRLGAIDLVDGTIVRVGFAGIAAKASVELTGVWQSADAAVMIPFRHRVVGEPIDLAWPAGADRIALWLATADSEIRDYFSEDSYRCSRRRRVLYPGQGTAAKSENSILAEIQGGEGERVEFKPFIRLDSSKAEELVRTAIAFANKQGGTLYLGVNDYQEIEGVERELREAAPAGKKGSIAECAAWYCAAIRKRISDRVSSAVVLECEAVQVCGKYLIRIAVTEAQAKPCCDLSTKEIWTRRGASTGRPDLAGDELRQLVNGSNQTAALFQRY